MAKRGRLEIMKDMLSIVCSNHGSIKITPLIRKSNLSSARFKEYYQDLLEKNLMHEVKQEEGKIVLITEKGHRFLEKYRTIISFIEEFEL